MPALSLCLLYCRDRANCMDGLIETVFLPRNRLIRAFADGGPGGGAAVDGVRYVTSSMLLRPRYLGRGTPVDARTTSFGAEEIRIGTLAVD